MAATAVRIDPRETIRTAPCDFCGCASAVVGLQRDGVTMCVACLADAGPDEAELDAREDWRAGERERDRERRRRP